MYYSRQSCLIYRLERIIKVEVHGIAQDIDILIMRLRRETAHLIDERLIPRTIHQNDPATLHGRRCHIEARFLIILR